jgi:hypothetical protein
MKIIGVYDNGGKTLDRYTVVTDYAHTSGIDRKRYFMALGLSDNPTDPQGFSQFGDVLAEPDEHNRLTHLGQSIGWDDLPKHVRQHAWERTHQE